MQEMLDPSVGEGIVQAMRKEVHRMELRHAELLRTQEKLMQVSHLLTDDHSSSSACGFPLELLTLVFDGCVSEAEVPPMEASKHLSAVLVQQLHIAGCPVLWRIGA